MVCNYGAKLILYAYPYEVEQFGLLCMQCFKLKLTLLFTYIPQIIISVKELTSLHITGKNNKHVTANMSQLRSIS